MPTLNPGGDGWSSPILYLPPREAERVGNYMPRDQLGTLIALCDWFRGWKNRPTEAFVIRRAETVTSPPWFFDILAADLDGKRRSPRRLRDMLRDLLDLYRLFGGAS